MENTVSGKQSSASAQSERKGFITGVIEMLPLCVSVIPWGILAGSMAVQSGLSFWQSVAMSAIIYAGAPQLVTLGLLVSGANILTIIISVFFITSQHLIYGLNLRRLVAALHIKYRLPIGFLLTDELFAVSSKENWQHDLSPGYLFGAGITFYVGWVIFSLIGIVMASSIPNLDRYHLDFSIIATFITIVVPMVKHLSTLLGVAFSLVLSMLLSYFDVKAGVVIAGCCGMAIAVFISRITGEQK